MVEERERMAEEKMKSAEKLIREYKQLRSECLNDKYNRNELVCFYLFVIYFNYSLFTIQAIEIRMFE